MAVGAGKAVVLIATGTGGPDASAITEALLLAASNGPKVKVKAPKGGGEEAAEQQQPEEAGSDQSDDDDDDDSEGVTEKKGPPVKWEALVPPTAKGKGRRRAAGAEGSDGEVGPRVVLR